MTVDNSSAIEIQIAEYLIHHGDGIREELVKLRVDSVCNPLLKPYFRDAVIEEVTFTLAIATGLNYEQVAEVLTEDYLMRILGKEWLDCERLE